MGPKVCQGGKTETKGLVHTRWNKKKTGIIRERILGFSDIAGIRDDAECLVGVVIKGRVQ